MRLVQHSTWTRSKHSTNEMSVVADSLGVNSLNNAQNVGTSRSTCPKKQVHWADNRVLLDSTPEEKDQRIAKWDRFLAFLNTDGFLIDGISRQCLNIIKCHGRTMRDAGSVCTYQAFKSYAYHRKKED